MAGMFSDNDNDYQVSLEKFIAAATAHKVAFGFTDPQIAALTALLDDFKAGRVAKETADAAAKAATKAKNDKKAAAQVEHRRMGYAAMGAAGATPDMLIELGFSVRDTQPTRAEPNLPLNLVVERRLDGTHFLRWEANGNTPTAMYEIEWHAGATGEFLHLFTVRALSYEHKGLAVGAQASYRVRALRGKAASGWSDTAQAYGTA